MPYTYADSAASAAVSPGRAIGGATLTLKTGDGAKFASKSTGDPTADAPMRVGVYRGGSIDPLTVLKCTGRTGDVLTISGAMDGYADAAVLIGDVIEHVPFAADFDDLQSAAGTPGPQGETGPAGTPGSVWREGSGVPPNTLGVDGDLFLDTAAGDVYRRASGAYSLVGNIKGPQGDAGPAFSTPVVGVLKGTGSDVVEAVADVDYATPAALAAGLSSKADDSAVVHLAGDETIAGVKTFSSTIAGSISGNAATATTAAALSGTVAESQVSGLVADLAAKADDSAVVHLAGAETITGAKAFSSPIAGSVTGAAANITGVAAPANGGTGMSALGSADQVLGVNHDGTSLEYKTIFAGTGIAVDHSANQISISTTGSGGGGSGTVTSVGLTMPAGLAVSGSPVTDSGTLAVSTTLSGVLKGTGTGFAAATAGTDYVSPSGLTAALAGYATLAGPSFTGTVAINSLSVSYASSTSSSTISTTATEVVITCAGDTYGVVRMSLQNRDGSNGVVFENVGVPLVDFAFLAGGERRTLRYETRAGQTVTDGPEFLFFQPLASPYGVPNAVFGDGKTFLTGKTALLDQFDGSTVGGGIEQPVVTLDVRGGVRLKQASVVTSTHAATLGDHGFLISYPGPCTLTLPSTSPGGQPFSFKDVSGAAGANNITIAPPAGKTIDGASSYVIASNHGFATLVSDGNGNFHVVGKG